MFTNGLQMRLRGDVAIDRYGDRMGVTGADEFARFHGLITAMDIVHQRQRAEQVKQEADRR